MGTTRKLLKGDIGGAVKDVAPVVIGGAVGGPLGATVAGALGSKEGKKFISSATGETARRQQAQTAEREAAETAAKAEKAKKGARSALDTFAGRKAIQAPEAIQAQTIDRGQVQDVTAPTATAAQIARGPQGEVRGQQMTLAQQLAARARGEAPSAAELQLQRSTDRSLAQQLALQAGATGPQAAAARRQAASQQGLLSQEAAREAAILRAQEQAGAEQALAGLTSDIRGADIGLATSQAGLAQQAELANVESQLRANLANQGVDLDVLKANAAAGSAADIANLNTQLQLLGMDEDRARAVLQAELNLSQQEMNQAIGQAGIQSQEAIARKQGQSQMMGGILGSLGTLGAAAIAASDVNLKKNIEKKSLGEALIDKDVDSDDRLKDLLSNLDVYDYDYKDEKFGEGRQTSVMAQDLEKSEIGKEAVIDTPEGKMVDYNKLLPAMLAANVDANKRIMSLEEALTKRKNK